MNALGVNKCDLGIRDTPADCERGCGRNYTSTENIKEEKMVRA